VCVCCLGICLGSGDRAAARGAKVSHYTSLATEDNPDNPNTFKKPKILLNKPKRTSSKNTAKTPPQQDESSESPNSPNSPNDPKEVPAKKRGRPKKSLDNSNSKDEESENEEEPRLTYWERGDVTGPLSIYHIYAYISCKHMYVCMSIYVYACRYMYMHVR